MHVHVNADAGARECVGRIHARDVPRRGNHDSHDISGSGLSRLEIQSSAASRVKLWIFNFIENPQSKLPRP